MNFRIHLFIAGVCAVLLPTGALAGPCDAYYPFDGNVADAGPNAYDGLLIAKGGEPAIGREAFSEGKYGQALRLTGDTAVRVPVDLDPATCPEGTITAWVKFEDSPSTGYQYLVSSGRGNGPSLARVGQHLDLTGGGTRLQEKGALRAGQWMFIAGTWDQPNKGMGLVWRNRTTERSMTGKGIYSLDADIWIGADDDNMRWPVVAGLIDEVRIYGRQLNLDEIQAARAGSGFAPQDGGPNGSTATGEPGSSSNPFGIGQAPPDSGAAIDQAVEDNAIQYESEAAALAAQRERDEAYQAELDRQQNEAEQQRRDEATDEATDEAASSTVSGYTLSSEWVRTGVSGTWGSSVIPMDFVNEPMHSISTHTAITNIYGNKPATVKITGVRGSIKFGGSIHTVQPQIEVNISPGAISGLKVCINTINSRVKGLEVSGNDIDDNGELGAYRQDGDQQSNCEWKTLNLCATGSVASGVYAHFQKASSGPDKVVGLQLICREVIPNE